MILRVVSNGRELLVDNKRKALKYYGRASDFRAPGSVTSVLSESGPVSEEKERGIIFLEWDEFVRRLN